MTLKLIKNPGERTSALTASRNLKMARSAHAYVRGSTVKFYEWLSTSAAKIPRGPPVWICGDCHLGNLGPLADIKGRVEVQIRDLDQTVIGNPAHDLIRLGLSLASAARGSDLPGVATARILEELARGYTAALAGDFSTDRDRSYRPEIIQDLLRRSVRRRWRNLADERLKTVEPRLPLGKRFWPLAPEEDEALKALFDNVEIGAAVSGLAGDATGKVELIDAAYWLKGCSSLGRLRFAAMVRVGEGKSASMSLIDIKEATTAAAPRARNVSMPRDNGVRVVTGARALSPNLGNRMIAARLLDKGVVLRELMPQDLKLEVDRLSVDHAMALARYLAGVVGRAHGRQMDSATREKWRATLVAAAASSLEAPTWLWADVVELLGIHEAAYLDHCRRFALAQAA
jgi:uncharacterized protein (DUF2252 family)